LFVSLSILEERCCIGSLRNNQTEQRREGGIGEVKIGEGSVKVVQCAVALLHYKRSRNLFTAFFTKWDFTNLRRGAATQQLATWGAALEGGGRGDSTLWLGCCTTISGLIPACYPSLEKYNAGVKRK
jgi:hypothetical protein